jgi:hypothetical protein
MSEKKRPILFFKSRLIGRDGKPVPEQKDAESATSRDDTPTIAGATNSDSSSSESNGDTTDRTTR